MGTDRIEKKTLLHAPLERAWRALSDAGEFGTWFGARFDGPFAPGARLRAVVAPTTVDAEVARAQKPQEGAAFEITIERMEPGQLFSFRWRPLAGEHGADSAAEPARLVEFTLVETGDGVLLTVTESGFDQLPPARRARAFSDSEQGWSMQMKLIEKYLTHARQP